MKYRIVVEAILDFGELEPESMPSNYTPAAIAEKFANMAISNTSIGADSSHVLIVEEIIDDHEDNHS